MISFNYLNIFTIAAFKYSSAKFNFCSFSPKLETVSKLTPLAYEYVYGIGNAFKVQSAYKSSLALTFHWALLYLLIAKGLRVSLKYVNILDFL